MASLCIHLRWVVGDVAATRGESASTAKASAWLLPLPAAALPRPGAGLTAARHAGGAVRLYAAKKAKEKRRPAEEEKSEEEEEPEPEGGEDDVEDEGDELGGGDDLSEGGGFDGDDFEPKPPTRRKGYTRIQDEEILPPGTRYQGGRYGLQFFVGDLVECMRDGELQYARVARIPTDERPMDGSFIVKWDSDGEEWKCSYKDLNKPRNPEGVDFPDWIEDWWPAEPPPPLAEELEREWTWVSDKRPGTSGGGMVPESPDQGVYSQNKDDPYRPRPGQVLYGVTC